MASIKASRFALLNIDDDSADEEKKENVNKSKQTQNVKKKNKKKKIGQQKENEELRNLAFAKGGKSHVVGGASGVGTSVICSRGIPTSDGIKPDDKQWKQWKEVDKEFTSEVYEKDLQHALTLSKLDAEESKQVKPKAKDDDGKQSSQKQKKKKDKPKTISLDEFQQDPSEKPSAETNGSGDRSEDIQMEPDPKFFKGVDDDVNKIIRKEQIQEEYKKQYVVESARTLHYKEEIRRRDEEIEKLHKDNELLEAQLKEVKERNQHLCMILGQGEMKQKAGVVMELDQLKHVRDELTEEVCNLTTELEKERSKVHALQSGNDKTKGGKRK